MYPNADAWVDEKKTRPVWMSVFLVIGACSLSRGVFVFVFLWGQ